MSADEYEALLTIYDWDFEYTEDSRVWLKGHNHRLALELYQYEFDRDFVIWDQYAIGEYKRGNCK